RILPQPSSTTPRHHSNPSGNPDIIRETPAETLKSSANPSGAGVPTLPSSTRSSPSPSTSIVAN
ncbi:hypothetical protein Droror1_Dr00012125, partial [Drosera rotundifolia]